MLKCVVVILSILLNFIVKISVIRAEELLDYKWKWWNMALLISVLKGISKQIGAVDTCVFDVNFYLEKVPYFDILNVYLKVYWIRALDFKMSWNNRLVFLRYQKLTNLVILRRMSIVSQLKALKLHVQISIFLT